ncbi:MAG: hypothetical protein ACHQNT_02025 [Bacteroidia bacterium]
MPHILFYPTAPRFVVKCVAIPTNPFEDLEAHTKNKLLKLIIAVIFFCWMLWLGYRLRRQEDAIKENDAKADAYFDSINKVNQK